MLLPDCKKIPVGHIVKSHGVKGELSVTLNPDYDFEPETGDPVILEIDGLDVPFFVTAVRPRGSESILLTLDEINSEEEAAAISGKEIFIYAPNDADESGDYDELTADNLVGYKVIDGDREVGKIADVREIGPGCWYFVLEDSGKLIPIVDDFISYLDHDSKTVGMELPLGLTEL